MMVTSLLELTIDLAALRHNFLQLRQRLSPGVKLLAVVKADAYGHGLVPAARTLAGAGAEYLGVASLEEGLALRQEGIDLPIVLLRGIVPQDSRAAVAADLEVILYRQDVAQALEEAGRALGKKALAHLKVDTGMGRLGVNPLEVLPFLDSLQNSAHLEVLGLISRGWELPLSHIANSAATIEMPEGHFGMARPGIALYGSPPAPGRSWGVNLKPVMSLTTQVLQLKRLPPGSSISYGGTYTTTDWCDLAVLPVGYCNGYPRLLSNRGEVLVKGRRAPIRGRVCMNLIMVDVSHIDGVREGQPVTLLGEDGGDCLTGDDLAAWAETISYEIYCSLGTANPRSFVGV
ncbi:MAG: alanine racemase [Syntrophobacterales bacterium]